MNRKQLQKMSDELDIAGLEVNIKTSGNNIDIWSQEINDERAHFEDLRRNIMSVRNQKGEISAHAFGLVSDIQAAYETKKKEIELRIKKTLDLMGQEQKYINALKKLMRKK